MASRQASCEALVRFHALFSELSAELFTSSVERLQTTFTFQPMPRAGLVYVFDNFHDFFPFAGGNGYSIRWPIFEIAYVRVTYDDTSKPLTPECRCLHNYQAGFRLNVCPSHAPICPVPLALGAPADVGPTATSHVRVRAGNDGRIKWSPRYLRRRLGAVQPLF